MHTLHRYKNIKKKYDITFFKNIQPFSVSKNEKKI